MRPKLAKTTLRKFHSITPKVQKSKSYLVVSTCMCSHDSSSKIKDKVVIYQLYEKQNFSYYERNYHDDYYGEQKRD